MEIYRKNNKKKRYFYFYKEKKKTRRKSKNYAKPLLCTSCTVHLRRGVEKQRVVIIWIEELSEPYIETGCLRILTVAMVDGGLNGENIFLCATTRGPPSQDFSQRTGSSFFFRDGRSRTWRIQPRRKAAFVEWSAKE